MAEMCENALSSSVMALIDRNEEMAESMIDYDHEIDEMELAVDRDCVKLLGEGGLDGENLRFVAAAMKISSDLERIGDYAVEVCEHVLFLVRERTVLSSIIDFAPLVEQVSQMMRESIKALVENDRKLAWKIVDEHLVIHDEMHLVFTEILEVMYKNPGTIERGVHILAVCKSLERVGDLATNVAEEVIYMVEGKNIRHHIKELRPVGQHIFKKTSVEDTSSVPDEEKILQQHRKRKSRIITKK
jgi:phosphate transport system protein